MTAKWRMAWRAIAASLAGIAALTAIMWFGLPYFAGNYDNVSPRALPGFIEFLRLFFLWVGAIFGGATVIHWLAAAKFGGADIRSRLSACLLGAAWLVYMFIHATLAFNIDLSWLEVFCGPPDPEVHETPSPCLQVQFIHRAILFSPLLLLALSAFLRILLTRGEDAL